MKLNINQNQSQADPYVIQEGDKYYMYVTGEEGVFLYESDNFYDWKEIGICYKKEKEKSYWAPAIIKIEDKFYLYVSSMPFNKEDTHEQRLQVAVSSSPKGPFEFICFILPAFSIDAHVVKSGNDLYLFYSTNDYDTPRAGTYIVLDKMVSPIEVRGKPKAIVRPTLDEEIYLKDRFKKGQHWHTIEGAFYFREGDYHYVMYSGNCYQNENYFIDYSVAYGHTDDLTQLNFKKYPSDNIYKPLIRKNDIEEGTGHNSLLRVKDKIYVVYHGRDYHSKNQAEDKRTARICEIKTNKEIIEVIDR